MTMQFGVVTDGSFKDGLTVRLSDGCSTEELQVGTFVVVEGEGRRYFSTVADLRLRLTEPALAAEPPTADSAFVRQVLRDAHAYATAEVQASLMLDARDALTQSGPKPVRTIPMHFAVMREAEDGDFEAVFGKEGSGSFALGTPQTSEYLIPLDLKRLVERSNGVFGQTGTGKSVLTRLLLSGIIKSGLASTLVFDMHNEYAASREGEGGQQLNGLRDLFGSKVALYSIDERDQARNADKLQIGLNQIEPADIALLADELNLTPTYAATTALLHDRYGERWLQRLLAMTESDSKEFCAASGAHQGALDALKRSLNLIRRLPYVSDSVETNVVDDMIRLLQRGRHAVLQFGRHDRLLDYTLVTNILTRRIHAAYTRQTATYEQRNDASDRPHPLVIVLEEAHKFLAPTVAQQTIFGTIAREMRKYSVTLMVVDQRPSGIDTEVLSQLGTKITGLLTDEHDIDAVLTGVAARSHLRGVLASLETKQQCLVFGHAIPMPMMLRTRPYDDEFGRIIRGAPVARGEAEIREAGRIANLELFGPE